jgi:HEAT repeat protein
MRPEAECKRLVDAALERFCRAVRQVNLYSAGHPIAAAALQNAADALRALLSDGTSLEIVVSRAGLEADQRPLDLGRAGLGYLHQQLHAHLIHTLAFHPGVQPAELAALIAVLNADPADLEDRGGAAGSFSAVPAPHIRLEQHDYRRLLSESEARWLAMFSGAAETRSSVVEQLVSLSLDAVGESEALLARARTDTAPAAGRGVRPMPEWAAVADEIAADRQAPGAAGASPDSAMSPDDYLAHSLAVLLQSAWEALAGHDYSERVRWRHQVGQLVSLLTPDMRARLFRADLVPSLGHTDVLAELARAMSADEAVDVILAHPDGVVNEPSAHLEAALRRVMADEQRLLQVEPLLRQRLTARGISDDTYRSVVGLLLDRIAKDRAVARADLGGDLNVVTAGAAGDDARDLADLIATVRPQVPKVGRREMLAEMLGMELTPGQFGEAVECVAAELARCSQEREMAAAVGLAEALAREADPATGRSFTQRALAGEALRRSGTSEVVACLAAAFHEQAAEEKLQTVRLLGHMGEGSGDVLLAIAGSRHSPQVAAEALRALARTGSNRAQTSRMVRALPPERAGEIIAALAAAPSDGVASAIGLLLEHHSREVRQRAVERLGEAPGPIAQEILLRALFDATLEIRAAAAESLGRMRARGAVLALSMAAHRGSLMGKGREVRKAAIRALGRIASVECAAPLIKVLRTGSLLFKGPSDELRALAAQFLAGLPGDEAGQALLAGVRDRRKAVSQACRQALETGSRRTAQAPAGGTP